VKICDVMLTVGIAVSDSNHGFSFGKSVLEENPTKCPRMLDFSASFPYASYSLAK
jgi:hypothetical protein